MDKIKTEPLEHSNVVNRLFPVSSISVCSLYAIICQCQLPSAQGSKVKPYRSDGLGGAVVDQPFSVLH